MHNIIQDPHICIDFYPGSHGNFLELVCNKMAGVNTVDPDPFYPNGAAHNKHYVETEQQVFFAEHWFFKASTPPTTKILSISFTADDALSLRQISFLRSGPYKFDTNTLENNTYHKLNNEHYRSLLDEIIAEYCIDESRPDCPRYILRDYFERNMAASILNTQSRYMVYEEYKDVYRFPYGIMYNQNEFIEELKKVADWADLQYNDYDSIRNLHSEFLKRQPYKDSKHKCDQVINNILNKIDTGPNALNLFEESYVNAELVRLGHERRY
jgi:hypothetical protein